MIRCSEVQLRQSKSGGKWAEFTYFNAAGERIAKPQLQDKEEIVFALAFSPDGRTLATAGLAGVVRIRDVDTGRLIQSLLYDVDPKNDPDNIDWVYDIVFTRDGARLAAGGVRGAIRVWDVVTGEPLVTIRSHQGGVNTLILSPDGRTLASSGNDGTVRLWNSTTGAAVKVLRPPPEPGDQLRPEISAGKIAFAPDGAVLAAVLDSGELRLWDVKKGQPIRLLEVDDQTIYSVAFSPDGKVLATGVSKGLRFWDWSRGRILENMTQKR